MERTHLFNENLNLTIKDLLDSDEDNFKNFSFFFKRVIELCEREIGKQNLADYISGLKCMTLLEVESFIDSKNRFESVENQLKISSYSFRWSLAVLQSAYKYCFYQNAFWRLLGGDKIYDIEHVLNALFALEDITASHQAGIVHKHFLEKYIKSENKKRSEQAQKAASIRHEESKRRYAENLAEVRLIWDSNNWKNYTDCANHIFHESLINENNHRTIVKLVTEAAKLKMK